MNNLLDAMIAAKLAGGGGGGGGGEVTPASIVTATGQMTEVQAATTRQNLGAGSVNPPDVVDIISATPTIEPKDNEIYNCGELTSLTISNPPATGKYSIIFFSGATATATVGIENFAAEANKRYKIKVEDNYATYDSWATS